MTTNVVAIPAPKRPRKTLRTKADFFYVAIRLTREEIKRVEASAKNHGISVGDMTGRLCRIGMKIFQSHNCK